MFYTVSDCPGIRGSAAGTQINVRGGKQAQIRNLQWNAFYSMPCGGQHRGMRSAVMSENRLQRVSVLTTGSSERGINAGKRCSSSVWQSWTLQSQ